MGRSPCCDKKNVKKGPWTAEEDAKLMAYISKHGPGNWTSIPSKAGLKRCGKSCRLRWTNYLRPDLKHDRFTSEEEQLIVNLHAAIGSRWSLIAAQMPGRTDNDVKNHWNTRLRKKLCGMGIDPVTHRPNSQILADFASNMGFSGGNENQMAKAKISSLSKDLRGTCSKQPIPRDQDAFHPHHPRETMSNISYTDGDIRETNLWDVLAQLNAITAAASAASNNSISNLNISSPKEMPVVGGRQGGGQHDFPQGYGGENNILIPPCQEDWELSNTELMSPWHCQSLLKRHMDDNSNCGGNSKNSMVLNSAVSNISLVDPLDLSSEYPLMWEFLDYENLP